MKKRIFILFLLLFFTKSTFAAVVETPVDMSFVFSFCNGTSCNVPN
jgi:hypothetical protein